ncbi:MAG TPA: TolC family protein [Pirellulales bacterium]|nr:TolC family protein [Pirellulales bacterium]
MQTNVPITSAAAQQGVAQGIPGAAPTPPAALLHPASYGASAENSAVAVGRNDFAATQIALAEPLPPPGVPTPLSLQAALETALAQNPDLVALRGGEPVSRAALGVARTYPINPWLQVQVLPFGQNIDGGATALNHYVLLMHTLELAHQGRFREQAGMADLNRVRWSILQAELLNVAQTQRLFFTALYQRGLRDLARATADVNAELASTLERQLDKGNASAAALAVAKLDRQSAERQARLADANYETALLDLRRQLNLPPNTAFEPQGDLTTWQWLPANAENLLAARSAGAPPARVPSRSEAVAQLASTRPDVMAARADVAMGSANVGLANAQRRPNLQIGPYYQRDDFGTVFVGFRSQFDIPVANNGRPLVRQREAELSQRRVVMGQAEQRARLEAEAAIDRYERARQLIEPVADNGSDVPDELQRLEKLYAENEIEVQQIVLARNSLLMARRSRLDSLNEAAQAAAAVTAATGLPPTALVVPRRP